MKVKHFLYTVLLTIVYNLALSQVEYINQIVDGEGGISGMAGTRSICFSKDMKNVYVTSQCALLVFDYDNILNTLECQASFFDDSDGIDGLYGCRCVEVSKDDRFVYTCSSSEHCITIFERNPTSGSLMHFRTVWDNVDGVDGLRGVNASIISNDDRFIYVVADNEHKISVFSRNIENGDLNFLQTILQYDEGGLSFPTSVKLSRDNKFLYVSSHMESAISIFSVDSLSGMLTYVETFEDPSLWSVDAIEISHDNQNLYSINGNNLTVFNRNIISGQLSLNESHVDNTNNVDGIDDAYSLAISSDDRFVFCISTSDSSLVSFSRDTFSGELQFENRISIIDYYLSSSGYSTNALICENDQILCTSYFESAVHMVNLDSITGELDYNVGHYEGDGTTVDGIAFSNDIEISPDNKIVYVSTKYDGISTFIRNDTTGELVHYQALMDGMDGLVSISYSTAIFAMPGNEYVLVSSRNDNALTVFRREENDSLCFDHAIYDTTPGVDGLIGPTTIVPSNDNKNIYVGTFQDCGISVFNLDTIYGNIEFVQYIDLRELLGYTISVDEICISNSGEHLFALSSSYNMLMIFRRDTETGILTLKNYINDYTSEFINYYTVTKMDISKDDKNLYVTFEDNNLILNFEILPEIDSIRIVQTILSDLNEGLYLEKPNCLKIADDDKFVYVTSATAPVLHLFQRNMSDGVLSFIRTFDEESDNFNGLDNPTSIEIDNTNRHIYITSYAERAISLYNKKLFLGIDESYCEGDTASLCTGFDYDSQIWSSSETGACIDVYSTNEYFVDIIDDYGNHESDTIMLTFYSNPEVNIGNDTTLCFGEFVILYVEEAYNAYYWNTGQNENLIIVDSAGIYSVHVTDINNCSAVDTIIINMFDVPEYGITGITDICEGDSTEFVCEEQFESYFWNDSISGSSISAFESGVYRLEIVDSNQCHYNDSIELFVHPIPNAYLGQNDTVSTNEIILLFPQGGFYDVIIWQDSIISNYYVVDSSSFENDSIIITVYVESLYGCYNSDTIVLYRDTTNSFINNPVTFEALVYPNPTEGKFVIETSRNLDETFQIEILNSLGQSIKAVETLNSFIEIDISSYQSGLYFVQVWLGDKLQVFKLTKH